jgi:hypothetical protein
MLRCETPSTNTSRGSAELRLGGGVLNDDVGAEDIPDQLKNAARLAPPASY